MHAKLKTTSEIAQMFGVSIRHIYRHKDTLAPARYRVGRSVRYDPIKAMECFLDVGTPPMIEGVMNSIVAHMRELDHPHDEMDS
jgi:hypothetical protein